MAVWLTSQKISSAMLSLLKENKLYQRYAHLIRSNNPNTTPSNIKEYSHLTYTSQRLVWKIYYPIVCYTLVKKNIIHCNGPYAHVMLRSAGISLLSSCKTKEIILSIHLESIHPNEFVDWTAEGCEIKQMNWMATFTGQRSGKLINTGLEWFRIDLCSAGRPHVRCVKHGQPTLH